MQDVTTIQTQAQNIFASLPVLNWFTKQLETLYDTARSYMVDDPIIYSPENYFPQDIVGNIR